MGMLLLICMLFHSDVIGIALERQTEPWETLSERTLRRSFRDNENGEEVDKQEGDEDDSLVGTFSVDPIDDLPDGVTRNIGLIPGKKSAYDDAFSDPMWKDQWYMHDYRRENGPVMDLNIVPVHKMGYTGQGIHVAVVDTGFDMNHKDLEKNLDKELAYTAVHDKKGTADPVITRRTKTVVPNHGTNSAGIIAMEANNTICGAGMAYNAKIIAINRESSKHGEIMNLRSLTHAWKTVDIYSNSWGPDDNGRAMDHLDHLTATAFDHGTREGRGRKGSIFTFSGGNGGGGKFEDNCSADQIVNYIYTIGVAGAYPNGKRAEFSETCTALFVTTYTGGSDRPKVLTTDNDGACTKFYTGTSSAAPQVSAVIALVLQANKELTYRDVWHVITMGAEVAPLADNYSWYKNGVGFWVSNEFGFGLVNALNMVNWAINWKNVPEKTYCEFRFHIKKDTTFRIGEPAVVKTKTDGCQESSDESERVFVLEQVILVSTIKHRFRGAVSIKLKSPLGTVSEILSPRKKDKSRKSLRGWRTKSVHNWGENPYGEWQIEVNAHYTRQGWDKALENLYQTAKLLLLMPPDYNETGRVKAFILELHGTRDIPQHHLDRHVPRTYSAFRTADGKSSDPLTRKQRTDGGLSSHHLTRAQME